MKRVYGDMPTSVPEGFSRAVRFPVLAMMDQVTGDHRRLDSAGGISRENMPHSIKTKEMTSPGHDGAMPSGALFEVTLDTDTGIASGRGFLLDNEMGLKTGYYIKTASLSKNSVDLADIKARFVEDFDTGDYWIDFTKWSIAATTIVATPAFASAHAKLDDEIMAAYMAEDPMDELVASFADGFTFGIDVADVEAVYHEITAAMVGAKVPFEIFHVPESNTPQKIVVDEVGRVYGHLALWESCHDGVEGQCLRVPRPPDSYASFNKPGVLTDRGIVQTGPIFTFGGHRTLKGLKNAAAEAAAYGGIENAWCDVRVTEGAHGPWLSGVIRPGVHEDVVYAARASRISGHWKGDKLKAIVSVNAEAFEVPGDASDLDRDLVAGFAFSFDDDGVGELVASFPPCLADLSAPPAKTIDQIAAEAQAALAASTARAPVDNSVDTEADARAVLLAMLLDDDD